MTVRQSAERFLVGLDESPWAELYRVAIGFLVVPLASRLWSSASILPLVGLLLIVLCGLRLGPAVARRVLPHSDEARQAWSKRRQLAKTFDSYQWQKLFWIGLGLTAYAMTFEAAPASRLLATTCLVTGATGLLMWRVSRTAVRSSPSK